MSVRALAATVLAIAHIGMSHTAYAQQPTRPAIPTETPGPSPTAPLPPTATLISRPTATPRHCVYPYLLCRRAYLPVMRREPSPTPTATLTPSPTLTPTLTPTATVPPPLDPVHGLIQEWGRRGLYTAIHARMPPDAAAPLIPPSCPTWAIRWVRLGTGWVALWCPSGDDTRDAFGWLVLSCIFDDRTDCRHETRSGRYGLLFMHGVDIEPITYAEAAPYLDTFREYVERHP